MAIFSTIYLLMLLSTMLVLILGLALIDFKMLERKKYFIIISLGFIVTRILSILVLYNIAGISGTSDLNNVFGFQANEILQGNIPYIDFESHYSPYFPYLLSLPYLVISKPVSILSIFIFFDLLTLVVGGMYVFETWDLKSKYKFYWIYSFVPLTWPFISFWNQDEVISAFFLTLSMLLIYRNQEHKAAICMGVGFLVTKFLILVFFIPLFLMMKKPIRNGLLTSGLIFLGYLPFIALGADVLLPFTTEAGYHSVGSNLWVILEAFSVSFPWYLPHLVVIICIFSIVLVYITSNRLHHLSPEATIVLFSLVYMIAGKKSFSFYVPIFLVFIIILFMRLYTTFGNQKLVTLIFLTYIVSFSILYQSVVVLNQMQIQTLDWYLTLAIYSIAIISQIVLIWIIVRSQYRQPKFYYWRIDSWIQNRRESSHYRY